ncbi:hypothetical protein [Nannocystis pusilla]|uniref:hypothetical protein n=1 Tax=Nannocystis pusilla TaxID=889268 RepID=UPI003BF016E0
MHEDEVRTRLDRVAALPWLEVAGAVTKIVRSLQFAHEGHGPSCQRRAGRATAAGRSRFGVDRKKLPTMFQHPSPTSTTTPRRRCGGRQS